MSDWTPDPKIAKDMNRFARYQLVPLRPKLELWNLTQDGTQVMISWSNGTGRTDTIFEPVPEPPVVISMTLIDSIVFAALHKLRPRLAAWALLGDGKRLRIAYTFGDAQVGSTVVDMPGQEPAADPEVIDDGE